MEGMTQRLQDSGYKRWLCAGHCLGLLKDALAPFTEDEARRFHRRLAQRLGPGRRCATACPVRKHRLEKACAVCTDWKAAILQHHSNPGGMVYLGNCNPSLWAVRHWEVAKVYMPRGQKEINRGAKHSDCAALLNLMLNCKHFHQFVTPMTVSAVINVRNQVMHSVDMRIPEEEMIDFVDRILALLQELHHLEKAKWVAWNVQQIKYTSFEIVFPKDDWPDGQMDVEQALHYTEAVYTEDVYPEGERLLKLEEQLLRERVHELCVSAEEDGYAPSQEDIQCMQSLGALLLGGGPAGNLAKEVVRLQALADRFGVALKAEPDGKAGVSEEAVASAEGPLAPGGNGEGPGASLPHGEAESNYIQSTAASKPADGTGDMGSPGKPETGQESEPASSEAGSVMK